MIERDTLIALARRCEAADRLQDDGGYALDGEIVKAIGWAYRYREETHSWGWCRPDMPHHFNARPPAFCSSLDAAMSLVPEGWGWGRVHDAGHYWMVCYPPNHWEQVALKGARGDRCVAVAVTFCGDALALCAACLRAQPTSGEPGI